MMITVRKMDVITAYTTKWLNSSGVDEVVERKSRETSQTSQTTLRARSGTLIKKTEPHFIPNRDEKPLM